MDSDTGSNILIKEDSYENTKEETDIVIDSFLIENDNIVLSDNVDLSKYETDNYQIIISNNSFIVKDLNEPVELPKDSSKARKT